MVGHNWGAEHAERWIWMQANEFARRRGLLRRGPRPDQGRPDDHAVDRERGPRRSTARPTGSAGSTGSARPESTSARPVRVRARRQGGRGPRAGRSEARNFVGWVYADPVGPEHNTVNCSISDLELTVERPARPRAGSSARAAPPTSSACARPTTGSRCSRTATAERARLSRPDDLELARVAARGLEADLSPATAPISALPIGLSAESLPADEVGLERGARGSPR